MIIAKFYFFVLFQYETKTSLSYFMLKDAMFAMSFIVKPPYTVLLMILGAEF